MLSAILSSLAATSVFACRIDGTAMQSPSDSIVGRRAADVLAGTPVTWEGRDGDVVFVDVWATWCKPCRESFPEYDALRRRHGSRGFSIVAVNVDEDEVDVDGFLRELGVDFEVVRDPEGRTPRSLAAETMPWSVLVDRRGIVRHVYRGYGPKELAAVTRDVEALLAE